VLIDVKVTNVGGSASAPDHALIQAAPLGAFVPWETLTALTVPALEPGESAVLRTSAERVIPQPLGDLGRIPPVRLLTAMGLADDEPGKRRGQSRKRSAGLPTLPVSPIDLLGGPGTYWAGNLNVFIGQQAVERHQAKSLRILPRVTNVVMFCVGDRQADSYRFRLAGLRPDWEAALLDPISPRSLARGLREAKAIDLDTWVPMYRLSMVFLALRPPDDCSEADIEVHVTQHSTQKTAVVEFSFDPRAAGPGCYVVS
jgi:hypothetical protein